MIVLHELAEDILGGPVTPSDTTARMKAEQAVAESAVLFQAAFADAPIAMALFRLDRSTLQVNRALCAMLGYTEEELLATQFRDITYPDDLDLTIASVARVIAGDDDAYTYEKRYIRKDGQVIWALTSGSLVRDETGAPLYFASQQVDITARKQAEAERAAMHQQTRQLMEWITDGVVTIDPEWRFSYVNAAAERLLGRKRAELLGINAWVALPAALDMPFFAVLQRAMTGGVSESVEFHYPPLDTWFDARIYPSPEGLSVFLRDVTASRQAARELKASEEKYRALIDNLPAVVYLQANDEAETPLYFSARFTELTGYSVEEALTPRSEFNWIDIVHPDDRDRINAENALSAANGRPFRVEYRYGRKDGSYVWVLDECLPVHDADGQIVAWQGVLLDISARVQAEEARTRLAVIVESAEDAIFSCSLDGAITSWNRGAERLYGYREQAAIGHSFTMLLPHGEDAAALKQTAAFGAPASRYEARWRRMDGTLVDVSVTMSPIRDGHGETTGVSIITRDITERIQVEQELNEALAAAQAATKTKSLFLAMMSHELRTPLQAVLGYADLLQLGPPASLTPEQRDDVGCIKDGGLRMIALIDQMLDLSRMEAGRLELAAEPVALATVIELVRRDIAPQAAAKGLSMKVELPPALPAVLGDPGRLRQILLNLASNGIKFTERGGVRITASASRGTVKIDVADTGIGIATEALPLIFEEFRQVDGNLTRRYGGAGLGLALARRLAEQMGGTISVDSTLGAGATFTLRMPVAVLPRAKARAHRADLPGLRAGRQ